MKNTPTSVMVLAIIGIGWSAVTFLGLLWSLVAWFVPMGPPNLALEAMKHDPVYITVTAISAVLSVVVTMVLLVASIGSLRLRHRARRGMIVYAWLEIGKLIYGTILTLTYMSPKITAAMTAAMPPGAPTAPGLRALMPAILILGACFTLLFMAYPICILYFFTRPRIIDAFNGIFPPGQGAFPVITPTDYPAPLPPQ